MKVLPCNTFLFFSMRVIHRNFFQKFSILGKLWKFSTIKITQYTVHVLFRGYYWRELILANLVIFHHLPILNLLFSFTVCMLNDRCLPIHQIKICQSQKISNWANFVSQYRETKTALISNFEISESSSLWSARHSLSRLNPSTLLSLWSINFTIFTFSVNDDESNLL